MLRSEAMDLDDSIDRDRKSSTSQYHLQINEPEIIGDTPEAVDDYITHHRGIYWRLLFLNLVVLWAYQSLISAQNYYSHSFAEYHIDFWGTVSAGVSMLALHILQLVFGLYKYGFSLRIIPGFIGYIVVAVLVMSIKNAYLLIISFGVIGALNTLTESPIYGIAGLFSTGSFTQAVQVGNGLAGFLNVTFNTIIRIIVYLSHSSIDNDQLSFYIFMSILILLCFIALFVYYQLMNIPPVKTRVTQQMAVFEIERRGNVEVVLSEQDMSFWKLASILKIHLFVQFYILFISLLLWPGIPCGVTTRGWFGFGGKTWWCSPFIIGTFNFGDLIGRTVAVRVHRYFSPNSLFACAILRTFFIIIIFVRHSIDNILVLFLIAFMGMTNGLLATVTFMVRPDSIKGVNNCERAAYLMTAALYAGIAGGSILAVALSLSGVIS